MAFLLRFLAVPVFLLIIRRRQKKHDAVIGEIEKLSLDRRLRLTWNLMQDERVPWAVRPLLLLPALYMASPIDLLPDFIPVIGRWDDAFVVSTAYSLLGRFVSPAVLKEHVDLASR